MSAIYLVILAKVCLSFLSNLHAFELTGTSSFCASQILNVYKWREEATGQKWWSFGKGSRHDSSNDGSYGLNSPNAGGGSNGAFTLGLLISS